MVNYDMFHLHDSVANPDSFKSRQFSTEIRKIHDDEGFKNIPRILRKKIRLIGLLVSDTKVWFENLFADLENQKDKK